jgi:hypothetical protein
MGSLNSIKCSCHCANKTQEDETLNCERKKDKLTSTDDLQLDNINNILQSDNRNNMIVNYK